jgi:uncharacterized protein (DUF2062 family)
MNAPTHILREKISGVGKKLTGIHADPHIVAMGYAMGIFLATTPFIGIKVPIGILLAFLFKWNKVAALIGILHINPLTGPFFYGFSFLIGKGVLGLPMAYDFSGAFSLSTAVELLTTNLNVFLCLLVGGLVIGVPAAVISYFISLSLCKKASCKTFPS